jgi:hypothetical protein
MRLFGGVLGAVVALAWALGGGCGDEDGGGGGPRDAGPQDASPDGGAGEDAGLELVANAGPPITALVGETVRLDASGSRGATRYLWVFGDGRRWDAPRDHPVAEVVYDRPGRFRAAVGVYDEAGRTRTASTTVTVTWPASFSRSESSTVAVVRGARRVAAVSSDADEVAIYAWDERASFSLVALAPTADEPRTVTVAGDHLVIPCEAADAVTVLRHADGGGRRDVALPYGARPYGAAALGDRVFVTLQGTGELAELALDDAGGGPRLLRRIPALPDARAIAALPGGRLAVTRWRSPDAHGEVAVVDPDAAAPPAIWTLAFDPQASSDTEIGGVPSYLQSIAVSPTGRELALPSLQAAIHEGRFRSGRPLTFETTVRAVISYVDLLAGAEAPRSRRQLDNRGFAAAATFSSRGDYLFVADRGARSVERIDRLGGHLSGSVPNVGFAPDGLALSDDDRLLFVNASLSRELVVIDVRSFLDVPPVLARLPTQSAEALAPPVLRGKRLFNDALDTRLGKDSYIACAHCHLDGRADGRTWDFTDRGEGLRSTTSLLGRAGMGHGPVHWSANFDEIQDFEHDLRGPFRGAGLLSDADWRDGTVATTLGDPKAGRSADLDALALYVASLTRFPRSPHRTADGALGEAARRGRALFESDALGCTACHAGDRLTDSGFVRPGEPLLHDVGTLGRGSGGRLGAPLRGIDTPTLHELFDSAPYLHDGSAPTLRDVLRARNEGDRHGVTSALDDAALDDLVAYLLALDGRRD